MPRNIYQLISEARSTASFNHRHAPPTPTIYHASRRLIARDKCEISYNLSYGLICRRVHRDDETRKYQSPSSNHLTNRIDFYQRTFVVNELSKLRQLSTWSHATPTSHAIVLNFNRDRIDKLNYSKNSPSEVTTIVVLATGTPKIKRRLEFFGRKLSDVSIPNFADILRCVSSGYVNFLEHERLISAK